MKYSISMAAGGKFSVPPSGLAATESRLQLELARRHALAVDPNPATSLSPDEPMLNEVFALVVLAGSHGVTIIDVVTALDDNDEADYIAAAEPVETTMSTSLAAALLRMLVDSNRVNTPNGVRFYDAGLA